MNERSLKRGWGLCFHGENWKLCSDDKWEDHPVYVANGREPFHGIRVFNGVEYSVFRCLDDSYFAQPTELCWAPRSENEMTIQSIRPYELATSEETQVKKPKRIQDQIHKQAEKIKADSKNPPFVKAQPTKLAQKASPPSERVPFGLEQMDD